MLTLAGKPLAVPVLQGGMGVGVTDILEVGPGKALSGFVKKTLGADVHCTAVETAEEMEAFLTSWKEAQA